MLTHYASPLQPEKGTGGIQNSPGALRKLLIKLCFLRIPVIKDSFSLVLALASRGMTDVTPKVFCIVAVKFIFLKLYILLGNPCRSAELSCLICGNFLVSRNTFIHL